MDDGSHLPLWGVIILLILIWLTGILYGFAAAVQNLAASEIEKKAEAGDKKAGILLHLLEKPFQYINAIPLMATASGLCFGTFIVPWIVERLSGVMSRVPALILVLLLAIILIASLSILAFRRVGTFFPERFAGRYVFIVYNICFCLYPLTYLITLAAKLAALPFGVEIDRIQDDVTEEEIISMVDEAHEQGVIEENEAEMIQNIISFNETSAGDIMTHRKNIVAVDEEMLLQEMVDFMLEEGNSRYPVYHDDLDNIVGIVHYKDALKFITQNSWAKFKPLHEIPGLIRDAAFIPETRGIGDLFHSMQSQKLHLAVVVDEYGQTAGIVTMEDILEEIVGEILDEYDEDEVMIRPQKDNTIVIDALADLKDVEEKLDIHFEDCPFETLNGVLTAKLGHIPTRKDLDSEIIVNGYKFRILSLGNKTIGRVRAEKTAVDSSQEKTS